MKGETIDALSYLYQWLCQGTFLSVLRNSQESNHNSSYIPMSPTYLENLENLQDNENERRKDAAGGD